MSAQARPVSAALLAAQQRLEALRHNLQAQRRANQSGRHNGRSKAPPAPLRDPQLLTRLPGHLGWESAALTAVLPQTPLSAASDSSASWPEPAPPPRQAAPAPPTLKLYPDVAVGMLRHDQVTVGRIWLLLRHLDTQGRGWLAEKAVRAQLTRKKSELHVCGWRHLRTLLARGDGLFWQRRNGRLWLRSLAKVAHALDVQRLTAKPVKLPVAVLTHSIGSVRAHFYASFHSGRGKPDEPANPIARETIAKVTTVHPRIQRLYEKKARVKRQRNFGVGAPATAVSQQEQAWQHGNALFTLTDVKGLQGRPGVTYLAWQLPNSYVGPHQPHPTARKKHLNRELVDLSLQGTTGNGRSPATPVADDWVDSGRRYCENGRIAAKLHSRRTAPELYWRNHQHKSPTAVWHVFAHDPKSR